MLYSYNDMSQLVLRFTSLFHSEHVSRNLHVTAQKGTSDARIYDPARYLLSISLSCESSCSVGGSPYQCLGAGIWHRVQSSGAGTFRHISFSLVSCICSSYCWI